MDFGGPVSCPDDLPARQPRFLDDAAVIAGTIAGLGEAELARLFKLSPQLTASVAALYAAWSLVHLPGSQCRRALFAYAGDVYDGLGAVTLDSAALRAADGQLVIASALYGLLGAMDLVRPYRLDFTVKLDLDGAGTRPARFWHDRVRAELAERARAAGCSTVVNLASDEYGAVLGLVGSSTMETGLRVITPVFEESGPRGPRVLSYHAKRARGLCARWLLEGLAAGTTDAHELLASFALDRYRLVEDHTEGGRGTMVFRR